jgi:histidyl-tRNA synthetase
LGDSTILAEIELVSATSAMLVELGFEDFKVRINDRRILKAIAEKCGFPPEDYDKVFIILDKMDKIGADGVEKELIASGYSEKACKEYMAYYSNSWNNCSEFCSSFSDDDSVSSSLEMIISCVKQINKGNFKIEFDPTLVRGMSYYTGTIFEIELPGYGFSIAGGGRYDDMIGKYAGIKVSACGFSIGFERIITILKDKGYDVVAVYLTKGESGVKGKTHEEAAAIRSEEAKNACKILGAKAVFLTQIDGSTEINKDRYAEMKDAIAAENPDIVITHWPIDSHPDHRVCASLVYDAWRRLGYTFEL